VIFMLEWPSNTETRSRAPQKIEDLISRVQPPLLPVQVQMSVLTSPVRAKREPYSFD
jgi:hypothetical protein